MALLFYPQGATSRTLAAHGFQRGSLLTEFRDPHRPRAAQENRFERGKENLLVIHQGQLIITFQLGTFFLRPKSPSKSNRCHRCHPHRMILSLTASKSWCFAVFSPWSRSAHCFLLGPKCQSTSGQPNSSISPTGDLLKKSEHVRATGRVQDVQELQCAQRVIKRTPVFFFAFMTCLVSKKFMDFLVALLYIW